MAPVYAQENPSWVRVAPFRKGEVATGRGVLFFFPVDNTLGNRDPVVGRLMCQVRASLPLDEAREAHQNVAH